MSLWWVVASYALGLATLPAVYLVRRAVRESAGAYLPSSPERRRMMVREEQSRRERVGEHAFQ